MKEKKTINVRIGQNVKRVRESTGLTQESFAEMLDLGVKHVSAIECGAAGLSLTTLQKICTVLSVPADMLLFGTSENDNTDERAAALQFLLERLSRLPDQQFWAAKDILDKLLEVMAAR